MGTIKKGNPFALENVWSIRKIGFTVIFTQIFVSIKHFIVFIYFENPVTIPDFTITLYSRPVSAIIIGTAIGVCIGFIIVTIAEVFRIGMIYREENELTV